MKKSSIVVFGVACALLGALAQEGIAEVKAGAWSPAMLGGKSSAEKAALMLDGATQLAESGSWELIAVGRTWYLGGDKAKGQALFDRVTSGKKVEDSDWYRIASIYLEAREPEKAKAAVDHAIALAEKGNKALAQFGAMKILLGDTAGGEDLVNQALTKHPKEFWAWLAAGGAYLGVAPML